MSLFLWCIHTKYCYGSVVSYYCLSNLNLLGCALCMLPKDIVRRLFFSLSTIILACVTLLALQCSSLSNIIKVPNVACVLMYFSLKLALNLLIGLFFCFIVCENCPFSRVVEIY